MRFIMSVEFGDRGCNIIYRSKGEQSRTARQQSEKPVSCAITRRPLARYTRASLAEPAGVRNDVSRRGNAELCFRAPIECLVTPRIIGSRINIGQLPSGLAQFRQCLLGASSSKIAPSRRGRPMLGSNAVAFSPLISVPSH
jgi:hypothetical protein